VEATTDAHPPHEIACMFEQLGLAKAKAKAEGLTLVLLVGGGYWVACLRVGPGRQA